MTAFTLIPGGWIDPFELVCSLRPRMGWVREETAPGHRTLRITQKVIDRWPEMGNALEAIEAIGQGQYERGETVLHMVDATSSVLIPANGTVLTTLRTNPNVSLHGPAQWVNPEPGYLVAVEGMLPGCVINRGQSAWVGLLIEARRKE